MTVAINQLVVPRNGWAAPCPEGMSSSVCEPTAPFAVAQLDPFYRNLLAALYLRGLARASRLPAHRAPALLSAVLGTGLPACARTVADWLAERGWWAEAHVLHDDGLFARASDLLAAGRVLTLACPGYPPLWRQRLGDAAPPALWRDGVPPTLPAYAVVGSRDLTPWQATFAREAGGEIARQGFAFVSGGARGADAEAWKGWLAHWRGEQAMRPIILVPCGLDADIPHPGLASCRLSVCAPHEGFSTAAAMERNALIYAMAEGALLVGPRLREGGTWHGGMDAQRRRLCPLAVVAQPPSSAAQAFMAGGSAGVRCIEDWRAFIRGDLRPAAGQNSLFGA